MTALTAPMRQLSVQMRGLDAALLAVAALLAGWGLVMVASASVAIAEKLTGTPLHFLYRQALFLLLGLACAGVAFLVPLKSLENSGFGLLLLAFFLLVLVLVPGVGHEVNGARRWLDLQLFSLQASEPARLALLAYLGGHIVRHQAALQQSLTGLLKPLVPIAFAVLLLLMEPDFGAAAILLAVVFVMLFLGGARLFDLGLLFLLAVASFAVLATTQAYRLRRLMSFSDPFADIENTGWQLAQSLIAIGRGEVWGVGLGNSVQKLQYLPEQHTDFIYAVLAEEFGLAGTIVLVSLFAILVWRGFAIGGVAERLNQRFRAYLAYGLTSWIGCQALINLAVNTGIAPTKGLTLPFMSYGGSSLITMCVILAVLLRIDHENRVDVAQHPTGVPE